MNHAKQTRILLVLFILNVLSSLFHYGHNMMYLPEYLEPDWITPGAIDMFWFIMTPFGVAGWLLFRKGDIRRSYSCLVIYCIMSLFVLLHYNPNPVNPTPWSTLSLEIQIVVWQEAVMAMMLWGYVFIMAKRYHPLLLCHMHTIPAPSRPR